MKAFSKYHKAFLTARIKPAKHFLDKVTLSGENKEKIAHANTNALLRIN